MFIKSIYLKICNNEVTLNNTIISNNWYELTHSPNQKKKIIALFTNRKVTISIHNKCNVDEEKIKGFFKNEKIKLRSLHINKTLIYKKKSQFKNNTYIIIIILIGLNSFLFYLNQKNILVSKQLHYQKRIVSPHLKKLNYLPQEQKQTLNQTLKTLKNLDCIFETISLYINNQFSITLICFNSLHNIQSQYPELYVKSKFITDIGGYYEISSKL